MEFIECKACAAKAGTPTLCTSCYQNRNSMDILMLENKKLKKHVKDLLSKDASGDQHRDLLEMVQTLAVDGLKQLETVKELKAEVLALHEHVSKRPTKET